MPSRLSFVFIGARSPLAVEALERAAQRGWDAISWEDPDDISPALEVGFKVARWVIEPGLHQVDAGRKTGTDFDVINHVLSLLLPSEPVILVSSTHIFSSERERELGDAPRTPSSNHGRRLMGLEDKVLARGGTVLRLGRVLDGLDPLPTRWRNGLKEGVPVSPFADERCAPLDLDTAAKALFDVMDAAPTVYKLSGPDEISYLEVAERLCASMGLPAERVIASSLAPSALGMDAWPAHVSLKPTANFRGQATQTSDKVVNEAIKKALA